MNDLESASLRLVCSVAAGLPTLRALSVSGIATGSLEGWCENMDSGIAQLSEGLYVPRSSCLNLALLRKLIVSSSGEAKASATKHIEDLLKVVAATRKHNDTLFATRYAILQEEDKEADHGKCIYEDRCGVEPRRARRVTREEPEEWPDLKLEDIFGDDVKKDTAKMLQLVGKCRCILSMYAQLLVQDPVDTDLHARAEPKVDGLLQTDKLEFRSVCRSMRLYLLKCMERARGLSFVRSLLAEPPLSDTAWVQPPGRARPKREGSSVFGRQVEGVVGQRPGVDAVADAASCWLFAKSQVCWPRWRTDVLWKELLPALRTFLKTFVTYGGRKMDDLLRWRVLAHLAAEPEKLTKDHPPFLPAMDEDIRSRVLKALVERGENIWKFKSHWKCSCGFTFFIGECGRPMEVAKCPGCSLKIGGRDHNQTEHTFQDDESDPRPRKRGTCTPFQRHVTTSAEDRSPWGYVLPIAEKDEKHVSFREVQSSSARAIRLMLHGTMYLGIIAAAKPKMPRPYTSLQNESMCTLKDLPESEYIGNHFHNDWKSMVEILSSNTEEGEWKPHGNGLKPGEDGKDEPLKPTEMGSKASWGVLTLLQRNSWEETIESKYLKGLIKNLDESLQDLYKKWGGDQEDGKFVAELKEAADVKDFPPQKREQEMPQLWAYPSHCSGSQLSHPRYSLTAQSESRSSRCPVLREPRIGIAHNAKENFPVLCTILQNPLINILPALGTLVGVFEWQALCINQFSGRITKAAAGEMTVGEVLEQVPRNETEKRQWRQAFKNFERAWRLAMPYCEYECLQISENMRKYQLSEDDMMLMCIPDFKDDGMYALAVMDWLVAQHNELVQIAKPFPQRDTRCRHRSSPKRLNGSTCAASLRPWRRGTLGYPARKVSSRLLAQHDVIKYNKKELMKFLSNRCATWGVGGKLNLDLKQVEQHLRRELNRPEVTIEMRGFQWLGDSFAAGNELRTVINQRELLPDTIDRLKVEIPSPALANACLQKVQMSISFILKSGSSLGTEKSGEMLLSDYMRSVLAESPETFMSAAARSDVHLWHVDALVKVLKQIVNKDPPVTIT
eukprot:g31321.t1